MLEREGKYGISHSSRLEFNGELSPGKIVPVLSQGGELMKVKERVPVQVVELDSRHLRHASWNTSRERANHLQRISLA